METIRIRCNYEEMVSKELWTEERGGGIRCKQAELLPTLRMTYETMFGTDKF